MLVVCDSSPIIALSRINKLTILNSLYKKILIPLAVKEEVLCDPFKRINLNKVSWIEVRSLKHPLSAKILSANLGKGESEALGLTLELNANLLIIDDLAARNMADFLEITYTGTLGILLKAKKKKLIPSLKEAINELTKQEFRVSPQVSQTILEIAGEQ